VESLLAYFWRNIESELKRHVIIVSAAVWAEEPVMRLIYRVAHIQLAFAMLALLVMGSVTVSDVFLKYVFNRPIVGAYDLVESLLPVVIFHGLPATFLRRQNIVIDLIDHIVSPRWSRRLITTSDAVVLGLLVLITWALFSPARQAFDYGDRKIELGLPLATIWAAVILGMAGVIVAAAANVIYADRRGKERSQ
jgi:TRAP-type C4-dicarboxylate transport system permease small subunit